MARVTCFAIRVSPVTAHSTTNSSSIQASPLLAERIDFRRTSSFVIVGISKKLGKDFERSVMRDFPLLKSRRAASSFRSRMGLIVNLKHVFHGKLRVPL